MSGGDREDRGCRDCQGFQEGLMNDGRENVRLLLIINVM